MTKISSSGKNWNSAAAVPLDSPAVVCIINMGSVDISDLRLSAIDGRGDWIRTSDLHTPSVMRYQAALRPDLAAASRQGHSSRQGANGRPSGAATAKKQNRQMGWAAGGGAACSPGALSAGRV